MADGLKILVVTPGFPSNANGSRAAKFVLVESLAYAMNGAKVKVITPIYPGAPAYEKFHENLEVERFSYFLPESMQRLIDPLFNIYDKKPFYYYLTAPFFAFFFFIAVFRNMGWADMVICQWTPTYFFVWPSRLFFHKPVYVTPRGSDLRLLPAFVNCFIFKSCTAIIDCYGPHKWNNDFKKKFKAHYLQVPGIVERSTDTTIPADLNTAVINAPGIFKIMYVGRFDYLKLDHWGLPLLELPEAAKILKEKGLKVHVFIIGDGEPAIIKDLNGRIQKFGVTAEVTLLGFKTNVETYIRYADIGVGGIAFNTVSQEFSIQSKPQILVHNHENAETPWVDKENALFVEAANAQNLAEVLEYAITDKSRLNKLTLRAQEMTQNYVSDMQTGGAAHLAAFKKQIDANG